MAASKEWTSENMPWASTEAPIRHGHVRMNCLNIEGKAMSLYRFKSRETGDLVMLQPHGRRILEILNKDLSSGVIQPAEMVVAVRKLRQAAEQEAADQQRLKEEAMAKGDVPPDFDPVTFKLRIVPFVEMLERCEEAKVEVVWGV